MSLFMMETPVTQASYQAITGKNPSNFKGEMNPVKASEHYDNPTGMKEGGSRVLRGGSWYYSHVRYLQSAFRNYYYPFSQYDDVGFRLVRTYP